MKTTIRLIILLLIIMVTYSCLPSKKITGPDQVIAPLSDTTVLKDGSLIYCLPMTVFTVRVDMERAIDLPGPYAKYAADLLGLNDVIMNEEEHWSVQNITVSSHEEADPSEFYIIQASSYFNSNALTLKKEGLILDLNPQRNYQEANVPGNKEINLDQFRSFDLGSDEYYNVQTDTAYRRVKVDNQFIRIPYIVETKKKLSESQLAEKAARRLMDLRDGKMMILTGEANVFPQSDAAINEMNRLEKEYTELFTGKTVEEKRTFTYQFIPQKELSGKPATLFRFSELTGPEDVSSKTGTSVTVVLSPEQKTKELTMITRSEPDPAIPKIDKLYYRIPDVVSMTIKMGDETLYNSRKLVYQFGEILQLPANYIIGK
jgi:Domain of unknown function (DUF4831)